MTFGFRLKIPGCISSLFLAGILRMLIKATIDGWCDVEIKKHELLSSIHGHLESIESSPGFFHIPSNCTKKDSRDDFALKLPSWQHGSRKINRCKVLTSSKSAESVSQPHFWNLNFSTEVNCQIFQHDTWDSSGWLWRICQRQDAQQIVSKENLGSTTCHVELKKELAEESVTKKAVWEVASVNVVWEIQIWVASWIQVQHLQAWCSKYCISSSQTSHDNSDVSNRLQQYEQKMTEEILQLLQHLSNTSCRINFGSFMICRFQHVFPQLLGSNPRAITWLRYHLTLQKKLRHVWWSVVRSRITSSSPQCRVRGLSPGQIVRKLYPNHRIHTRAFKEYPFLG